MTTADEDAGSFSLFMIGSASTSQPEPESEAERRVRELRELVHEVTGMPVEQPKQRIGFLP